MRMLSDMASDELASLSDQDFQEVLQTEARSHADLAVQTYVDVAQSGEDENARVKAADRLLAVGGFQERNLGSGLPSGVSEEVFKLALVGFAQLAGIAKSAGSVNSILRDVAPARSDPRSAEVARLTREPVPEPSPEPEDFRLFQGERYEIVDRTGDRPDA